MIIQGVKNKIFKPKRLLVALGVLVLLFLSFSYSRFSFAYPPPRVKDRDYRDILPSYGNGNINDLLDLNIQALIQGSLHETLNDLPSFNLFQDISLPLDNAATTTEPREKSFRFQDVLDLKDLNSGNAEEIAKSIFVLVIRLFLIAIISVVQVVKVFFDLFMSRS